MSNHSEEANAEAIATALLEGANATLVELESKCCQPLRSPRMAALADTLKEIEGLVPSAADAAVAESLVSQLDHAGSQIGGLQVTCCAPARMPLYSSMLTDLMKLQRWVKRQSDLGH